jgi:Family of unknown function (DUF5677)
VTDGPLAQSLAAIARADYSADDLAAHASRDETPFDEASFYLLREMAEVMVVTASAEPQDRWDIDDAVLVGLLVRCCKLVKGFLQHTVQHESELANYLLRGLVETSINVRFLAGNRHDDPGLTRRFRAHSFLNDKRLLATIDKNQAARGGVALPIEDRIASSIARRLDQAGLTEDDIPAKMSPDWGGNFRERLRKLDMEHTYEGIFGSSSGYTHGSWHDLVMYHLQEREPGRFAAELDWSPTRPQTSLSVTMLLAQMTADYADDLLASHAIRERADSLNERAYALHELHENWIGRTGGPPLA